MVTLAATSPLDRILPRLHGVKEQSWGFKALCPVPAHSDTKQSLSVRLDEHGNAALNCFAGCSFRDILAAMDLPPSGAFADYQETPAHTGKGFKTTEVGYDYTDADGQLLYQVVRLQKGPGEKGFFQRKPDGNGGFSFTLNGVQRVPYRLQRLRETQHDDGPVVFVEGEKDVHTAEALGFVATTTSGGAGNFKPSMLDAAKDYLTGRDIVLLPDNDDPGRRYMEAVASALRGIASCVRWLELPGQQEKGDPSDWVAAGGTRDELLELIASAPEFPLVLAGEENGRRLEPDRSGEFFQAQPQVPHSLEPLNAENASPRPQNEAPAPVSLVFLTAPEFTENVPDEPEWIAKYVVPGAITDITGAPKLSGKTSLALGLAKAITSGATFLGEPTRPGAVIYLTEESTQTFAVALRTAGLEHCPDFHVLTWRQAHGVPWEEVMAQTTERAKAVGALVIFIDTFLLWSGLREDKENDAGACITAMEPLMAAAAEGLAIWSNRHDRKAGGRVGESGRGSSAIAGAADILLQLNPVNGKETVRQIRYAGRFDSLPAEMLVERTTAGYRVLSGKETPKTRILEVAPTEEDEAQTAEWFIAEAGIGKNTVRDLLKELSEGGELIQTGGGVAGDPYRYYGKGKCLPSPLKVPYREGKHEIATLAVRGN